MKRLDLILNGKGGVGKSFFCVNFVQFLKDKAIAHVPIDSDNENSTLKRFHPDARFLDLENRCQLDGLFTALEKSSLVVMDCRAASTELFIDYFAEIDRGAGLCVPDSLRFSSMALSWQLCLIRPCFWVLTSPMTCRPH